MQGAATPNAPLSKLPTTFLTGSGAEIPTRAGEGLVERKSETSNLIVPIPTVRAGSLFECQYTVFVGEGSLVRSGLTSVVDSFPESESDQPAQRTASDENGVESIRVVEHSLLWQTTGKGERDFGIHLFERRRVPKPSSGQITVFPGVQVPAVFRAVSPVAPLSYYGKLISIEWLVRVRVFLQSGRQLRFEQFFALITE